MSYAGRSLHSLRFPIFDGNDYLYWKERTRIRIQAINFDLWQIVEDGYTLQQLDIFLRFQKQKISCVAVCQKIYSFDSKSSTLRSKSGMPSKCSLRFHFQNRSPHSNASSHICWFQKSAKGKCYGTH